VSIGDLLESRDPTPERLTTPAGSKDKGAAR
jgi:hypothetical protein